jgi:Holliday junction resolvase RusA-like endonuclease
MISCTIETPPPLSALTKNARGKGRVKTDRYKDWIKANEWIVALAAKDGRAIVGPYALTVRVSKPDNRPRDITNIEKAISDLLVRVGAVRDDSDCQRFSIEWSVDVDGTFLLVMPTQLVPVRKKARA